MAGFDPMQLDNAMQLHVIGHRPSCAALAAKSVRYGLRSAQRATPSDFDLSLMFQMKHEYPWTKRSPFSSGRSEKR
jgi:hypothetical protein